MNASKPRGIVTQGITPQHTGAYRNGSYEGISQLAWPPNMNLATPQGQSRWVIYNGPYRARAAGPWNRGDRLITANNLGQVASVATLGLPIGTAINVVAGAEEPAMESGDVAEVTGGPCTGIVVANPAGGVM